MLRAAAALMVLMYHLSTTTLFANSHSRGFGVLTSVWQAVGFAGVDLFFVISGVVMAATCYERFAVRGEPQRFLLRRVIRIFPLYWAATAAVLAISWLAPHWTARDHFSPAEIAKSLALWPQEDFPVVAVGWTLTYEMFFYLTFAALLALPRRWAAAMLMLWAFATLALYPLFDPPQRPLTARGYLRLPVYASPLVLEFIAGCAIGWLARRKQTPAPASALAFGLTLLTIGGGYFGTTFPVEAQYSSLRVAVFGVAAALVAYGAIGLELAGRLRIPRQIVFWGDASYATYLTHMYVILLVTRLWPSPSPDDSASLGWAAALACLIACGAVATVCHVWFERPLHRLLSTLTNRPTHPRQSYPPTQPLAAAADRA